ncbi:MAG: hypothetical protein GIW98_02240 [Candidatus Eremiobacteraeota bacterium]|nr:hypothetical protein [Candidatus Eremiobacteraeota bacterium]
MNDDRGVVLPEYALVFALLSIVSIAALTAIAATSDTTLGDTYTNFTQLQQNPPQ